MITSFNYKIDNAGYFNGSIYNICIKQRDNYCLIDYHKPPQCGFKIENHEMSEGVVFSGDDCVYDYVSFGGYTLCGHTFPNKVTGKTRFHTFG